MILLQELENLIEMPLRISQLVLPKLENIYNNRKMFKTVIQTAKKDLLETTDEGVELWKVVKGKTTEIYGIIPTEEYVAYYVRWELQSALFIDTDWATQVLVWGGISHKAEGLPKYVFFQYVLPFTGTVVSDGEQTERGEKFWQRMIDYAFAQSKYNIYLVDFNKKRVGRIKSHAEYLDLYHSTNSPWGDKPGYHNRLRIAISDHDFAQH